MNESTLRLGPSEERKNYEWIEDRKESYPQSSAIKVAKIGKIMRKNHGDSNNVWQMYGV